MHDAILDLLRRHAIDIPPVLNGEYHRNGAQFFRGEKIKLGEKEILSCEFGDYSRALKLSKDFTDDLSPPELEAFKNEKKRLKAEKRKAQELRWEQVAEDVEKEWQSFSPTGTSPYLERKGIKELYGCKIEPHPMGNRLVVPARDASGKLYGYQTVYGEKLSITRTDKIFRTGARKEACFHMLGGPGSERGDPGAQAPPTLLFTEGFATAVAVHESLGRTAPVVACFDAGNLLLVAKALRGRYPDTEFVFCADNDCWPKADGRAHYAGEKEAKTAAKAVGNARVVVAAFASADGQPTDFDDLRRREGAEKVREQILQGSGKIVPDGIPKLRPLKATNDKGKPVKPAESAVADELLKFYGTRCLAQDQDVFIYKDGYWQHQDRQGVKLLKQQLAFVYGKKAGSRDLEAAFKYFLIHAPMPPVGKNLFTPPYFAANFTNGTLHFVPEPGGKPMLKFKPHDPEDYLITQLPFEFPGLDCLGERNPEFEKMLGRIFGGDSEPEKASKQRILAQMFGAAMMPCYSKIFFLVGPKGSGKSTVMKLLYRLLDQKNVSHVDPSMFHGFHMETMVGKLLNMDTDIDLHKPINDAIVKKVIDRIPFRIARKFQTDVVAPLAPIHVFGANDMPKSMEGSTGAYERRAVVLLFRGFSAEALGAGNYSLDYDDFVWQSGWQGILAFALRGLRDLVESRGHFHSPESSREAIKEWDKSSDIVTQFIEAIQNKELDEGARYFVAPGAKISNKNLWAAFEEWCSGPGRTRVTFNQDALGKALRKAGFVPWHNRSGRGWNGIGVSEKEGRGGDGGETVTPVTPVTPEK